MTWVRKRIDAEESKGWLSAAIEPSVVRRASGGAVIVAAILIPVGHGDAVLTGSIDNGRNRLQWV